MDLLWLDDSFILARFFFLTCREMSGNGSTARLSQGKESIEMEKRIQALEEIILEKVDQGSTGGDLREENLLDGLKDRVSQLEAKIT